MTSGLNYSTPQSDLVASILLARGAAPGSLPPLVELTRAATELAEGQKRKALIPLSEEPLEYALERRGAEVLVSCYETTSSPQVRQLNHPVSLKLLLKACAKATFEEAKECRDLTFRALAERAANQASLVEVARSPIFPSTVRRQGVVDGAADRALSFEFAANFLPNTTQSTRVRRSDLHAMLFDGVLWAWIHGRRVRIAKGPVMLAAQRMIVLVRSLLDAWQERRSAHIRLVVANFIVDARLSREGNVHLALGEKDSSLTIPELEIRDVVLPILRLGSDLIRAFVAVDRSQNRNLRVTALRDEIRALRRRFRRASQMGFVNEDVERVDSILPTDSGEHILPSPQVAPRFAERWRVEIDGLDAMSTFLCGESIIVSSTNHLVSLDRESGEIRWIKPGGGQCILADGRLAIVGADGGVELCKADTGEVYAHSEIRPTPLGMASFAMFGGGGNIPTLVISEPTGIVGIDLRSGELRWRMSSDRAHFQLIRAGQIAVAYTPDGVVHALDARNGEEIWRFVTGTKVQMSPHASRSSLFVVSTLGRKGEGHHIDLASGAVRWSVSLAGAPLAPPRTSATSVFFISINRNGTFIECFDRQSGERRWIVESPEAGASSAAQIVIDGRLFINSTSGDLVARDIENGSVLFSTKSGDPAADDIPRRLRPLLRGGALFVPGSDVHIMRLDGQSLGNLNTDLTPDWVQIDERHWTYVAEESGFVCAYAPVPHLRLISGGR